MQLKLFCLLVVVFAATSVPQTDALFRKWFWRHLLKKGVKWVCKYLKKKYGRDTLMELKNLRTTDRDAYENAMQEIANDISTDLGEEEANEMVSQLDDFFSKDSGEMNQRTDERADDLHALFQ